MAKVIKKACKGTSYPKTSNVSSRLGSPGKAKMGKSVKKAAKGTSLGMKSVKAGFDKNPGVTRADIIVAAKGQAKKGKTIKKAEKGTTTSQTTKKPISDSTGILRSRATGALEKIFKDDIRNIGTNFSDWAKKQREAKQYERRSKGRGNFTNFLGYKQGGTLKKSSGKKMIKKAQNGAVTKTLYQANKKYPDNKKTLGTMSVDTTGYAGGKKRFTMEKTPSVGKYAGQTLTADVPRRKVKKFLKKGPEIQVYKKGGKMTKKCRYGCK